LFVVVQLSCSASQRCCWEGGKVRRRGEQTGDVKVQLRLVVFDGEDVVAAPLQHFGAPILLAEHGVAGDHLALQGQDA
jgi:hypothetical protein